MQNTKSIDYDYDNCDADNTANFDDMPFLYWQFHEFTASTTFHLLTICGPWRHHSLCPSHVFSYALWANLFFMKMKNIFLLVNQHLEQTKIKPNLCTYFILWRYCRPLAMSMAICVRFWEPMSSASLIFWPIKFLRDSRYVFRSPETWQSLHSNHCLLIGWEDNIKWTVATGEILTDGSLVEAVEHVLVITNRPPEEYYSPTPGDWTLVLARITSRQKHDLILKQLKEWDINCSQYCICLCNSMWNIYRLVKSMWMIGL